MPVEAPLWRYFVAALDGSGITDYSRLASDRTVEVILNGPLSTAGTVPSDNPQVWIPYDGDGYDDPYLSEGTRLLWGFRREPNPPYQQYVVRAATIIQLVEDAAQQDDARTRFVGWDPWHYMMSRPVTDIDGVLPGPDGISWDDTEVGVIVAQLLRNTILNYGHAYIDAGTTYEGTAFWGGSLSSLPVIDWNIPQGTSVGQAWQDLCAAGYCDIVLDPIYDPLNRPNYLCDMSVYAQAGVTRDEQIFAWNTPGRNLVGLDRQQNGALRVNVYEAFAGQGGTGGQVTSIGNDSITKYGAYVTQRFFPGAQGGAAITAITSLAEQQIALRSVGQQTVTFTPAPERSPRPWVDYQLGDRVPVWALKEQFRQLLSGEAAPAGTFFDTAYQRIYGWTASIDDDALETVTLLVSPQTGGGE